MQVCGDIMSSRLWEYFQGPSTRHYVRFLISFGGIGLLSMEDCIPLVFLRSWVLMVLYLCSKFHIFYKPILEEYIF
jgi:hypothetical protein